MKTTSDQPRTDLASKMIRASVESIYQAFVDPEAIVAWLPPEGMTGQLQAFDPRPGGRYQMTLTYGKSERKAAGKTSDDADVVEGKFLELVPNKRIVQGVKFRSEDPAFAGTMKMTWSLNPAPEGTEVTIVCTNIPVGVGQEDHEAALKSTLDNLAAFTE